MHRTGIAAMLCMLVVIGFCLWLFGECAEKTLSFDPELWLDRHGEEAERVALRAMGGESLDVIPRSRGLRDMQTRVFPDAVSFTAWSWPSASGGLCYSKSGKPPPLDLSEEPPDRWEHVRDHWYYWVGD